MVRIRTIALATDGALDLLKRHSGIVWDPRQFAGFLRGRIATQMVQIVHWCYGITVLRYRPAGKQITFWVRSSGTRVVLRTPQAQAILLQHVMTRRASQEDLVLTFCINSTRA